MQPSPNYAQEHSMTGDTAIAKILKAEGLDWFSCFPNHSLIDACAKEGLPAVLEMMTKVEETLSRYE